MSDVKWRAQCATMTQINYVYVYVWVCVYVYAFPPYLQQHNSKDWLTYQYTENIYRKSDFTSTSRVRSATQCNQSHKPLPKQDNNTCFTLTHITHTSLPSSYCVSGSNPQFPSSVFRLLSHYILISSENK